MSNSLRNKVAIVTAGSTGFGRGIAVALARAGAKVIVGDIRESTTPGNFDEAPDLTTSALASRDGGACSYRHCDVTKQPDAVNLVRQAVATYGRLDILVNNAGIYRGGAPIHELTIDGVDACYNVLVRGTWFMSQEAIKQFLHQDGGGNIINIVSTAGLRGHIHQAPYNMAKAAQANLTRCIALEYASNNIRANGVCPTYVKTSMSRGGFDNPERSEAVTDVIPLHRWGEISDVVNAALFLASDESAFLTGVLLPVDGGETLSGLIQPRA